MNCLRIDQIYSYIENELTDSENKKIKNHLATCKKCTRAVEERKRFLQAANTLPAVDPPPELRENIMAHIFPQKTQSWLPTAAIAFFVLTFTIIITFLASGQSLSQFFINFFYSLLDLGKNIVLICSKILKLGTIIIEVIPKLFGYLINSLTTVISFIPTETQIVFIIVTILLSITLLHGAKRLFSGGETL